jgi:AcrR family transcriptional regulator
MKHSCIDIRSRRREQIVEAAIAVIAEQGIQNLSLSEIEKKAGMSRGQLTYYFPAKEEILLAVFDRHLQAMHHRLATCDGHKSTPAPDWNWVLEHLLGMVVAVPPTNAEFHVLQYTFLSQIGHREDFRERLATLYEAWRTSLADRIAREPGPTCYGPTGVAPRTMASLVQAILHGLSVQLAADANAFDREEMSNLCQQMLGTYVGGRNPESRNGGSQLEKTGARRSAGTGAGK